MRAQKKAKEIFERKARRYVLEVDDVSEVAVTYSGNNDTCGSGDSDPAGLKKNNK